MSGFWGQLLGTALVFGLIEATEEGVRWLIPGKSNRWYGTLKVAYGLPVVLIAGAFLFGLDRPIHWLAVALGAGSAAAIALLFFSAPKTKVSK